MYFPFMIDLSGRRVVIIGGGAVAHRKCELFLDFGAEVTLVSPELRADFSDLGQMFHYVKDCYKEQYLQDALAVIAASDDPAVNRAVATFCRERLVPVNVVDVPELCTFFVPAIVRRGDLTIAISTAGKSPAMAGHIRKELSAKYGVEYALRLQLLGSLRTLAKEKLVDSEQRRETLMRASTMDYAEIEAEIFRLEQEPAARLEEEGYIDDAAKS